MKKNDDLINIAERGVKYRKSAAAVGLADGEHRRYLLNAEQIAALPQINVRDAEQLGERVKKYFEITAENDARPTFAGLALALGVSRESLRSYNAGGGKMPEECREIIRKAVSIINVQLEDYLLSGSTNIIGTIFLAKNNLGYRDQSEVLLTPNNPLGDINEKELERRYLASIPEATETESKE